MSSDAIVALEIGTTKVVALVGEMRDDGRLVITGLGKHASKGVRKGEIVDLETAVICVRSALVAAEENGPVTIHVVRMAVSGGHIQSQSNRGTIRVMGRDGVISPSDIEQVKEVARGIVLAQDREVIHSIRQNYYIDGEQVVSNPEGMVGTQLSVDMLILHGIRGRMDNAIQVVHNIPMDVEDVAFGGLCSALAVVPPEHKEIGALVIDLGGGTTDYVVYADKILATAGSLGLGGDHITNDIALAFGIPIRHAEALKQSHGSAVIDRAVRSRRIDLPQDVSSMVKSVSLNGLHTVINARAEEILNMVKAGIESAGLLRHLGAGVVLTGGGANLKGITQVAEDIFNTTCRIGVPRDIDGITEVTEGPEYATAVGMLRYGFQQEGREGRAGGLKGLFGKLFGR